MREDATIRLKRAPMRRWIATIVLLTQMMAGICVVDASVSPKNACCKSSDAAASLPPCTCCRLDTPSIPSLTASAPFKITPPTFAVTPARSFKPALLLQLGNQADCSDVRATALSPPKLYVLNTTFLI
ncbi:MAG: hypothetical protein M1423_07940 [Acidobacteria bacterium]|nr:hypothetical protein [Acidobacteriota bacterium]